MCYPKAIKLPTGLQLWLSFPQHEHHKGQGQRHRFMIPLPAYLVWWHPSSSRSEDHVQVQAVLNVIKDPDFPDCSSITTSLTQSLFLQILNCPLLWRTSPLQRALCSVLGNCWILKTFLNISKRKHKFSP